MKNKTLRFLIHACFFVVLCILVVGLSGVGYFSYRGHQALSMEEQLTEKTPPAQELQYDVVFPVGVNPHEKEISENPAVATYFERHISPKQTAFGGESSFVGKIFGRLALESWFQNLASLTTRVLVIEPGERKEQIATHFGKILGWSSQDRQRFLSLITEIEPALNEGKFYPGTYTVSKGATPEDVAPLVRSRFESEVLARYTNDVQSIVPLKDTLTIASLLEREAYNFEDKRHISGVIWNRLFADMRLQIDATLQYAKGSTPNVNWWPRVLPSDKYISSAYNTYKNPGLPPAPIANASLGAILAALNPLKTDCMYYFHDSKGGFHCSKTYEEHVSSLKEYYGQGK